MYQFDIFFIKTMYILCILFDKSYFERKLLLEWDNLHIAYL